jgi:hypothetical protein
MKQPPPCSHVFFSSKGKSFLVFSMGMRSSGQTLLDGTSEIGADEFDSRIDGVLREALDSYETTVPPHRVWRPPDGIGTFIRKHLCVSVRRMGSGDLDVVPLRHEKGGYVGNEGEHVLVASADVPAKIASVLKDAFSMAT